MNLVQVLPKGRFGEMISFEFHLKNRHEKTQKPLWLLGFQPRYLFRCYLLIVGEAWTSWPPGSSHKAAPCLPIRNIVALLAPPLRNAPYFFTSAARLHLPPAAARRFVPTSSARRSHNPAKKENCRIDSSRLATVDKNDTVSFGFKWFHSKMKP